MLVIRISSPSSLVNLRFWRSFKTVSPIAGGLLTTAHRVCLWLAKEKTLKEWGEGILILAEREDSYSPTRESLLSLIFSLSRWSLSPLGSLNLYYK